jgi:type IV fimbrial biogenesis protein FimT
MTNRTAISGRMQGFTIIQLMVALTIVAVLTGLAIPSYRYVTNGSRISGEINNLLGDLQYARYQAIKQGQPITVCASSNGTSCLGSTATTWNTGWIVFNDANGNATVDPGEAVTRVQQAFSGTDTLTTVTGGVGAVTFNREGFPVGLAGVVTVALYATPVNNQSTRCVQIGLNGQIMTETYGVNSCT